MPYENGTMKDPYDPRRLIRNNPVIPTQPNMPPAYCYDRSTGKPECAGRDPLETERDYYIINKVSQPCMNNSRTTTADITLDMRAPPFYFSGGQKVDPETHSLAYTKSPYNGIAAAAAAAAAGAHRKVGAVQFGLSRMY